MDIIFKPRATGKTHDAVLLSAKTGATMVYHRRGYVQHALDIAKKIGVTIPNPISYKDLRGLNIHNGIILDDFEYTIQDIIPQKIISITMNDKNSSMFSQGTIINKQYIHANKINNFLENKNITEEQALEALEWYFK